MQFTFTLGFVQLEACAEQDGVAVPDDPLESAGHLARDPSTQKLDDAGWDRWSRARVPVQRIQHLPFRKIERSGRSGLREYSGIYIPSQEH